MGRSWVIRWCALLPRSDNHHHILLLSKGIVICSGLWLEAAPLSLRHQETLQRKSMTHGVRDGIPATCIDSHDDWPTTHRLQESRDQLLVQAPHWHCLGLHRRGLPLSPKLHDDSRNRHCSRLCAKQLATAPALSHATSSCSTHFFLLLCRFINECIERSSRVFF